MLSSSPSGRSLHMETPAGRDVILDPRFVPWAPRCPAVKAVLMPPLVDLHRHLEGSIRPETSLELATRIGTDLLPAQWRSALVAAEREEGLLPYLAKIENAAVLVRTLDDWRRVTVEAVTDAHADGLAALELRFAPQFIAGVTGLDADDVIDAVSDAVAGAGLPIEVGLIGIVVRDQGPDSAGTQIRRLLRHQSAL